MFEPTKLAVEVAVARGGEMLSRVVLRPPEGFSVGTSDEATFTIKDSPLQSLIEVISFGDGRPVLSFHAGSKLEVDVEGERLAARDLIQGGLVETEGSQHRLLLTDGIRAIVTLGSVRLFIKVRVSLDVSIWDRGPTEFGRCGGCSGALLWPPGTRSSVLIPCPDCGDLNRSSVDPQAEGLPSTDKKVVPSPVRANPASLPSSDGIEYARDILEGFSQRPVEAVGPDSDAFDDEDEATELVKASPPEEIESVAEVEEDEAPTDPGRNHPLIAGPSSLPPAPAEVAVAASDLVGEPVSERPVTSPESTEGSPSSPAPSAEPAGGEVAALPGSDGATVRRRRMKAKPNYVGWGLVFFGMLSGLAGLFLLALTAWRIGGGA